MSHNHDWYDDYKAYSRMNAGRTGGGGGDDWGCLGIMLLTVLAMPIFYVSMLILSLIGNGILALLSALFSFLQSFAV